MTKMKNSSKGEETKMSETRDILSELLGCKVEEDVVPWRGKLGDYIPMVIENPFLNETAHARICRMIEKKGVSFEDEEKQENPHYKFFTDDLYGIDSVLEKIMQFFRAAAAGSEVKKRILLLWGPTSSGKSEFAILLKKGLEVFTKSKEGKIFAIDGCPMFENPLNAVPEAQRQLLKEKYGIAIEGDLCPRCAYRLAHEESLGGRWENMPVKRVFLSEMNRIGIGTFQPGDVKCVKGDTKILTTLGLINIEDLEEYVDDNGVLDSIKIIKEDGKSVSATNFFKYKNKEVVEITTELNYNITATHNHPLQVVDNYGNFVWKNAGLLSVGDTLILGKGAPTFNFEELPKNDLNLKWNGDLAWILGVFVAEGSYRRNTIEIANCNDNLKDRVQKFAESIDATFIRRPERITFTSKKFVTFLKDLRFSTGAHNKEIPSAVFHSSYLIDFLSGMWLGDGNLGRHKTKNTNEASYGSVSKNLARQVHLLLLVLGIPSSLDEGLSVGTSGFYVVRVRGKYVEKLQQIIKMPKWKITRDLVKNKFNSPNCLRIPKIDALVSEMYKPYWKGTNWFPYIGENSSRFSKNSFDMFIKNAKSNGVSQQLVEKLEKINSDEVFYVDIKKITNKIADVYDIEVPGDHFFIANGFISHNSQSQSELVGSVNFAKLEKYGVESHPLAYNFDGELNVANRGLMEFIELLKVDPKFRHILLTLTQEKRIKVERFPLIYADLVPIGHTNEVEFIKFKAAKAEEALHDRTWLVKFPYNLKLHEEVRIYEKLICNTPGFQDIHIAPHTLKIAAMFAVLSRLVEPQDKGITLLQKMQLYNGDEVDGFSKENIKELQKESEREGLDGISPRYIINRLSTCFAKHGVTAVTPIGALRSIKDGLSTNAKIDKEEIGRLENLISDCIVEYNKIAVNEVQKAFFVNFEHEINNLLENYLDNVEAYLDDTKTKNEWGDLVDPDENLMRSVEEKVEVTTTGKDSFREEIHRKMMKSRVDSGKYDYQSHPKLKEALQKQLFDERADVIRLTVSSRNPDPESLRKLNSVIDALIEHYGYNAASANELLRYVNNIMSKTANKG